MSISFLSFDHTLFVAIAPQPTQPKIASQNDRNISNIAGISVTLALVSLIIGYIIWHKRNCQKQRYQQTVKIIKEIDTLERLQSVPSEIDRAKQIETLEKIWKRNI